MGLNVPYRQITAAIWRSEDVFIRTAPGLYTVEYERAIVKVVVLGSGSFGTAIGSVLARNGHGESTRPVSWTPLPPSVLETFETEWSAPPHGLPSIPIFFLRPRLSPQRWSC